MRRNSGREASTITSTLDNTCHERSAIQLVHLLGHADKLIYKRVVVANHVFVRRIWVRGFLESIGAFGEEVEPERCGDELEEGDDVQRASLSARGFAVEEQVEEFEAYWMTLNV